MNVSSSLTWIPWNSDTFLTLHSNMWMKTNEFSREKIDSRICKIATVLQRHFPAWNWSLFTNSVQLTRQRGVATLNATLTQPLIFSLTKGKRDHLTYADYSIFFKKAWTRFLRVPRVVLDLMIMIQSDLLCKSGCFCHKSISIQPYLKMVSPTMQGRKRPQKTDAQRPAQSALNFRFLSLKIVVSY